MEEKEIHNAQNHREAFLVYDPSLCDIDAPFFQWLRDEGFAFGGWGHGHYKQCPWVYVSITRKKYVYGIPGIKMETATGNHAITMTEFQVIYSIFKKYEGKDIFVFKSERFDCDA